jgi:hypothetical protein
MVIRGRGYYTREDDAYYELSLIEVVDIVIHDTVLGLNVLYKHEPLAINL